ncbi:hypothetical protein [Mycolicibacterium fortuitum]|uniref:hypothetical protein n=1 Tax=Mycolicibacterium fortuitum TaxID=1766 RepID=UPI003AAF066F
MRTVALVDNPAGRVSAVALRTITSTPPLHRPLWVRVGTGVTGSSGAIGDGTRTTD